jgi:hypothetical protein
MDSNSAESGTNDLTKEIAGGVRGVFDRIGEFFHLFDLSFFVSGTATFAALVYWSLHQGHGRVELFARIPTWVWVIVFIIACYICGLLSFAAGRLCAKIWRKGFQGEIASVIEQHRIAVQDVEDYLDGPDKPWRLYERLWVDIRESRKHASSFSVLNRYWVMAATYDGIAMSSLIWLLTLVAAPPLPWNDRGMWLLLLFALASTVVSFIQGHNYFKYQVREIVATLAASTKKLVI